MQEQLWKKDGKELAEELLNRSRRQRDYLQASGIWENSVKAIRFYYGKFWDGSGSAGLGSAGEQGELITTAINHFASIVRHGLSITTEERLTFDATSENSDPETRDNAIISEAVLNHYFYTKSFATDLYNATELAVLMGTAYLEVYWDDKQKLVGSHKGKPVYKGAPKFRARSFLDVTVDKLFESDWNRQGWVVVRDQESRWDLIAQHPKLKEKILRVDQARDDDQYSRYHEEDNVWVYRGYHRECPSMPMGRELYFLEDGTVLQDNEENPYVDPDSAETPFGGIPLLVLRPTIRHGSHYGHTKTWDLIPMQENHNVLESTIATNQINFGLQHIAVAREANINRAFLGAGTAVYEYDVLEGGAGLPTPLQLCATPAEIFNHRTTIVNEMETIFGINAIMRGKVETSIPPTGVASAIFTAQGQVMNSDLQTCYYSGATDSAVLLLYIISRFQKSEEVVKVIGRGKGAEARQFSGSNVQGIRNVRVSVGNPLAKTLSGKAALAELGMQYQIIKTPEQLMEILQTGNIRQELEHGSAELDMIRRENDAFLEGKSPLVLASDNHVKHYLEHKVIADNYSVRNDPKNAKVLEAVLNHMEDHADQIDLLQEQNPQLFTMVLTDGMRVPMPLPGPESGLPAGAGGGGAGGAEMPAMSQQDAAVLEELSAPNTAAAASESTDNAALAGLKSAEASLAQASGEEI